MPNTNRFATIRGCALSMLIAISVSAARAVDDLYPLCDEFDTEGSETNWMRIYQTEGWGNNVLETFDVDTSRPDYLVMVPHTSSWYGEYRGELTYHTVTGDFAITTFVEPRNRAGTGRPERLYSLAGIMVRMPRAMTNVNDWTAGGQNYVFLSMGSASMVHTGFEFEVKTTTNSMSTLYIEGTDATRAAIQVVRVGAHLIMLHREEGGNWTVHRRYFRPDFPAVLQAGLTVYTDWEGVTAAGVESNNRLVLTNGTELIGGGTLAGAQPDLVAAFDYVRYARVSVPSEWVGADLSNPGAITEQQLLSFMGDSLNIPGGAKVPAEFNRLPGEADGLFRAAAQVVSQRSYRVQTSLMASGPWSDTVSGVSTGTVLDVSYPVGAQQNQGYFRIVSP